MLNKENLHHAYLLEGEKELVFQYLLNFLEKELNFQISANPDFYIESFDTFGINDGRLIKDFQSKKSITEGKQIIIIQTNFITNEAQNSLLKMFEEPSKNTHIFLIIPSSENLLTTLKSRLTIIKSLDLTDPSKNNSLGSARSKLEVGEFLQANITKRFELIKVFLPKKKDEKADKAGAILFLNSLEKILYEKFKSSCLENIDFENIFYEINQCRSYLNDRSPSVKMILEHLSQIIPKRL